MIISDTRAIQILEDVKTVEAVPSLLNMHEAVKRELQAGKGQGCCGAMSRAVNNLGASAIDALAALTPEEKEKLKASLHTKDLYAYMPVPGGRSELKKI
jgi:hypothetical protein